MVRVCRISFIGSIFSSSAVFKVIVCLGKGVLLGLMKSYILSTDIAKLLLCARHPAGLTVHCGAKGYGELVIAHDAKWCVCEKESCMGEALARGGVWGEGCFPEG